MNILIVDDIHPVFLELVQKEGFKCDYRPTIRPAEISKVIHEYEGIVVRSKCKIDKELLTAASKLKFVVRAGAGMDNIDEKYAKECGIICFNAPEGNRDAVGEHALGMLLNLFRHISKSDREIRNRIWDREGNRGIELKGKTIGIIGYGNTGKAFAKKLSGFDVCVLAYDKYLSNYSDIYANTSDLNEIQLRADIISFHVPLTNETKNMFNEEFLYLFKKPIYVINTSRGKVIETSFLIKSIKSGKVLGAALDVIENEKVSELSLDESNRFNELITNDRVLLTSHIAGWTFESYYKISIVMAEKIIQYYKNKKV